MDRMLISVFVASIHEQARFALIADTAARQLTAVALDFQNPEHEPAGEQMWLWLHTLVNSAANVSKALFPRPTRAHADEFAGRGAALRRLLEVNDDSPLHYQERQLRNHLEHMDERIEDWWISDPRHNIARRMVGPLGRVVSGLDDGSLFEQYDPDEYVLAFRGDVYELRPVVDELRRVAERAARLNSVPHWKWDLPDDLFDPPTPTR